MQTIELLRRNFDITDSHIREGLEQVISFTGLKGRWQTIRSNPTVVCDTAHNFSGVQEVMHQISMQDFSDLFIVWGMVKDKDVAAIFTLLPKYARFYFCQAAIPRAMDAVKLQEEAMKFGLCGQVVRDVNEAKNKAISDAGPDDFIFIGGSTFVVAEIDEI